MINWICNNCRHLWRKPVGFKKWYDVNGLCICGNVVCTKCAADSTPMHFVCSEVCLTHIVIDRLLA